MGTSETHTSSFKSKGFAIHNNIFSIEEMDNLIEIIEKAQHKNANFRKDKALFAVRNVIKEIPEITPLLWTEGFKKFVNDALGSEFFLVKSIYFNKPPMSNWLVAWHQDTKIEVEKRQNIEGYGQWSEKEELLTVRPPVEVLENICTVRIHLDDCDATNGALKVVPKSHTMGILNDAEILDLEKNATLCEVEKGGILLMKPLILHASSKSTSLNNRRVLHLEFASVPLAEGLAWKT
jgi:Phytanoyl-CoA dioxygenase (PhyH)